MRKRNRIYHRTKLGERALRRNDRSLAPMHRRLLVMLQKPLHSDALPARSALTALEARGLVESVPMEWLRELYRLGSYEPTSLDPR